MRKFLLISVAVLSVAISCTEYDDSALRDRIDALEKRMAALEEKCAQINSEIENLSAIIDALGRNVYVTDVTESEGVYTIFFSDGRKVTISSGSNVKAPQIGVELGEDGLYYWTVDGERMKDPVTGEDIPANAAQTVQGEQGPDGITPRLRIYDGWWQVSYDNGETWTNLSVVSEGSGADSVFGSVVCDDDSVTFVLSSDGSTIVVPRAGVLSIEIEKSEGIIIGARGTVRINYTLSTTLGGVSVSAIGDGGYTARVEEGEGGGVLVVKAPEVISPYGKVLLVASRPDGRSVMKILHFQEGVLNVVWDGAVVPANGAELSMSVSTDYALVTVQSDSAWASAEYSEQDSILSVSVEESSETSVRSATISLLGDTAGVPVKVVIVQAAAHAPSLGALEQWLLYSEEI